MIDESLLKSNFIGRDGFRWWIGQIPPAPYHRQGAEGWGNRYRVRIMGYHPFYESELKNDELPWAQVMIPTTAGSGAANQSTDVALQPSDVVFGFFLDGDNAQLPVIMGTFGRTNDVTSKDYKGPFQPFTGYTDKIQKPTKGTLVPNESNETGNAKSQTSPVARKESTAKQTGDVTLSSSIGDEIVLANPCKDTTIDKITARINNFIKKLEKLQGNVTKARLFIKKTAANLLKDLNAKVGEITKAITEKLTKLLQKGLELLYKTVFANILAVSANPVAAHLGGVAAQTAMVKPVQLFQKALKCLVGNVMKGLKSVLENMLTSVADNITKFTSCVADQFVGSILNKIVGTIETLLDGPLGALSKILTAGFSIANLVRGTIDAIKGIGSIFQCGQSKDKCKSLVTKITIGGNPAGPIKDAYGSVLGTMNDLKAAGKDLVDFSDFKDPLGACFGGPPTNCGGPKVTIFGGNGSGATAKAIMGTIIQTGSSSVGSVIGVQLTGGGSGYEFPPFVSIEDNCGQGYGAIARSIINENGEVTSIYVISEGENYPVEDFEEYGVIDTIVDDPGSGYGDGDRAVDNLGTEYKLEIDKGSIVSAKPININIAPDLPLIRIISDTGTGGILRPVLGTPEYQGEVKQVIDCIS